MNWGLEQPLKTSRFKAFCVSLLVVRREVLPLMEKDPWLLMLPPPGTSMGPLAQILGPLSATDLFVAALFGGAASSGRDRLGRPHLGSPGGLGRRQDSPHRKSSPLLPLFPRGLLPRSEWQCPALWVEELLIQGS